MSTSLKQLSQEVWRILDPAPTDNIKMVDLKKYINEIYRKVVKDGELIEDSAISTTIASQERYDLTSATVWIPDSGTTDSGADINEGATFSATDVTLTVDDGTKAVAGQLIKIDDEVMRVTLVASNDWTVVRGEADTTAASHADGTDIYIGAALNVTKLLRVDYDGVLTDFLPMDDIEEVDVS